MFILFVMLIVAVVLTACGTKETGQEQESKEEQVEEKVEAKDEKVEGSEIVVEPRVITHLMGETSIEGTPEKIATLMPWISDFLLSLDIEPHAATSAGPNNENFSWYLEEQLTNTKNLGWALSSNIEMMLDVEPDLILANQAFKKVYEDYSKIAPTIILGYEKDEEGVRDMRQTLRTVAEIVQKEEEATKVIADYDEFVEKAREEAAEAIGEETVMFLRVTAKELRYYSAQNFGVLYNDLGLKKPSHFPDNSSTFEPLSFEMLPEVNPDHIFLLVQSEEKLEEVKQTPLWDRLTAVQNDQVYPVDYDLWFQGFGPIANKLIIEDALAKLKQ